MVLFDGLISVQMFVSMSVSCTVTTIPPHVCKLGAYITLNSPSNILLARDFLAVVTLTFECH